MAERWDVQGFGWELGWPGVGLSAVRVLRADETQAEGIGTVKDCLVAPAPVFVAGFPVAIEQVQVACSNEGSVLATTSDELGKVGEEAVS